MEQTGGQCLQVLMDLVLQQKCSNVVISRLKDYSGSKGDFIPQGGGHPVWLMPVNRSSEKGT